MTSLPDCQYCRKDQRLHDLMIELAPLSVSMLYLFKEQTYRGRCVVAYHGHGNELYELPDAELAKFMQDVARTAKAMRASLGAAKINYGAYSDKLPHLHVHLVPKYVDGPSWGTTFTMMPEPKVLLSAEDYAALGAKIRSPSLESAGGSHTAPQDWPVCRSLLAGDSETCAAFPRNRLQAGSYTW